ncbi:MAG: hypothetical protein AB1792_01460 [Candidatus Zixiibacteriota bacterium]
MRSLAAPILVITVFIAQAICLRDVTIDDVGISYRYARHLAEGAGLTWNVDEPPVEGYSNLLWVLILAGAHRLGLDIDLTARILGVLFGAVTLWLLALLIRRIAAGFRWWQAAVPLLLVALNPAWVMWHVSGLEIGLYGTALTLIVLALTEPPSRRRWLLALGVSVLILTRPEGSALAPIPIVVGWIADRRLTVRHRLGTYGIPLAMALVVAAGLITFRLAYYGYPLPNTVYAKFSTAFPSKGQVLQWIIWATPFWLAWGYAIVSWRRFPERSAATTALVLVVAQTVLVLPVNPVMNFLHRYLIAFLPLAVIAVPYALTRLERLARWVPAATAVALLGWSWQLWPPVVDNYHAQQYMHHCQLCVTESLQSLPGRPRIALGDAGRIPYWTDLPATDEWGLCERRIAHEGFSPSIILGSTDVFIAPVRTRGDTLWPVFGYDKIVMLQPRFREEFRLWLFCTAPPSERRESPNPFWYLDYALYMKTDFAARHGIPLPQDG